MLNNTGPLKGIGHRVNSLDKLSVVLGIQEKVYAVVIDAGSTGSRVLAFTFYRSLTGMYIARFFFKTFILHFMVDFYNLKPR